jgi:dTDP-glucose 4,6-dehydratase
VKHYLITGGAGFIGSNFIHLLYEKYDENEITIHNIDKLTYAGNLENLKEIENKKNYYFYQYDITDTEKIESIFQKHKIDIVINFAAESHVDRSIMCSKDFIVTNILGTQTLLDISNKYKVAKYIQISTDEVYGSLKETGSFTEQHHLKPNSPYAASKAGADLLVRSFFKTHKLPCIITRCSNNYGPYQFPEKLIPLMVSNALDNKALPVYGKGENVRDWIYVKDHCKAIELICQKGIPGEVYNIGGNSEQKNIDIVKTILKILKKDESLIQFVKDRLGHDFRYAIDYSKINNELGWEPEANFDEGLESTIGWYLNNQKWWQRIKSGEYKNYYNQQYNTQQ